MSQFSFSSFAASLGLHSQASEDGSLRTPLLSDASIRVSSTQDSLDEPSSFRCEVCGSLACEENEDGCFVCVSCGTLVEGVSTQHVEKAASSMHSVFRRRVPDSGGRKDTSNSISSLIQSANEYTKMWLQEDCISGQTSEYLTVIYVVEMQCDALCEQFADGVWVLKKAARQILKMCMERARKNAQASNRRESLVHLTLYSTLAILYLSFAISGIDVFVNDIIRWAEEGIIPYYNAYAYLPVHLRPPLHENDFSAKPDFLADAYTIRIRSSKRFLAPYHPIFREVDRISSMLGLLTPRHVPYLSAHGLAKEIVRRSGICSYDLLVMLDKFHHLCMDVDAIRPAAMSIIRSPKSREFYSTRDRWFISRTSTYHKEAPPELYIAAELVVLLSLVYSFSESGCPKYSVDYASLCWRRFCHSLPEWNILVRLAFSSNSSTLFGSDFEQRDERVSSSSKDSRLNWNLPQQEWYIGNHFDRESFLECHRVRFFRWQAAVTDVKEIFMKAYRQGVSSRIRVRNRYRRQYPPRSSSIGSTLSENDCSDDHVSFSNSSVRSQRGNRSTSARPCSTQSKPNDDEVDPQNASVSRVERIASIVPDVSFSTYGGERWLESLDQRRIPSTFVFLVEWIAQLCSLRSIELMWMVSRLQTHFLHRVASETTSCTSDPDLKVEKTSKRDEQGQSHLAEDGMQYSRLRLRTRIKPGDSAPSKRKYDSSSDKKESLSSSSSLSPSHSSLVVRRHRNDALVEKRRYRRVRSRSRSLSASYRYRQLDWRAKLYRAPYWEGDEAFYEKFTEFLEADVSNALSCPVGEVQHLPIVSRAMKGYGFPPEVCHQVQFVETPSFPEEANPARNHIREDNSTASSHVCLADAVLAARSSLLPSRVSSSSRPCPPASSESVPAREDLQDLASAYILSEEESFLLSEDLRISVESLASEYVLSDTSDHSEIE